MVVTSNTAVYAPTTQGLCTACALCKPGELSGQGSRDGQSSGWGWGWAQLPTVVLTCSYPSPSYGSGQQCCYTAAGTQLLTSDSTSGSTPDRGHDWGAPPYRTPPRVPGMSHWLYDVISFYYCCLWAPECPRYMRRRPSSDCRSYRPPRLGRCWPGWERTHLPPRGCVQAR